MALKPKQFHVAARVGLLTITLFACGVFETSIFLVVLVVICLLYDSYRKQRYQATKEEFFNRRLAHDANHLRMLMQQVPPWIDFSQKEKVEWLNTLLETLWPFAKVILIYFKPTNCSLRPLPFKSPSWFHFDPLFFSDLHVPSLTLASNTLMI